MVLGVGTKKWILIEEKKESYSEIKKWYEITKLVESNCTSEFPVGRSDRSLRQTFPAVSLARSQYGDGAVRLFRSTEKGYSLEESYK